LFLQKCESLLRRFLRRSWTRAYGKEDWPSQVFERASGEKMSVGRSVEEWTLRDLVGLAKATARDPRAERVMNEVEVTLGHNWRSALGRVTRVRNDLAHGRVYEYADLERFYPMESGMDRSEEIRGILDSARVYLRLLDVTG
jgi:hypothetical protein